MDTRGRNKMKEKARLAAVNVSPEFKPLSVVDCLAHLKPLQHALG